MSLLLVLVISVLGIISGKLIFRKWFNHLTLYCVIMGGTVFLYELKLLPYPDLIPLAWFYIISTFLSFLFGVLTITSGRNMFRKEQPLAQKSVLNLSIFIDGGKSLKYSLIFFSVVTLLAAIQHWIVLIEMFGSIPAVLLNAAIIYSLSLHGEVEGVLPYISYVGYVAIFFSGIYTAYKGKFTLLTFFPFIGVIIKELAVVGRAGMLFALLEFLFTFFLFRHLLNRDTLQRFKFSKVNGIIAASILAILIIAAASLIRIVRGSTESFAARSTELSQFRDNIILTPTVYLYLSSDPGVLSKYLQSEEKFDSEVQSTKFGQNTFLPVYSLLSKFGFGERVPGYQRPYYISAWTNTGTYIRELHADFGIVGTLLGAYLIGLSITWFWFNFYEHKNIIVFAILVYLNLIVGFSFLVMVTRLLYWFISLLIIILYIPILEKIASAIQGKSEFAREKV